uniref:Succinate:cytochrome c oxidoreductase subunit 4 n=1 Tax=Rhodogorgon sp. TaxID=2485824 RepID=A0A3G3MIT3_9FLOR|nr:succinate:cytochrome c oxidoreductase subunit 4 [Rhodogorgon sp.]
MNNMQWWLLRLSVLILIPVFLIDLEIIFLFYSFVFLHISLGLRVIINDYVHNEKLKCLFLVLNKLCNLEFIKCILEFLI